MRYLVLMLLILCEVPLASSAVATLPDSLQWIKAERMMAEDQYKEAAEIYKELGNETDSTYQEINSHQVADLRKTYSIDQLELESNILQNGILRLALIVLLTFIILSIGCFLYLRKQSIRLSRSKEELQKAKNALEVSFQNKSLLLSNMSHEIRTPLNALSGFSDVLTTPGIDKATRTQCNEVIQLNSKLLLKLVNDVIDISCLDVNSMQFHLKTTEAVALCQNVINTLEKIKQTKADILFETSLLSLEIETDTVRLQQVLINLLVNATKFTKEGTITLRLEKGTDGTAVFSVEDTGCGIPIETQSRIFERFEKLSEKVQGTGLGLSICQLIINRLGGEIWIDAHYTEGARFVFTHPLKPEELS